VFDPRFRLACDLYNNGLAKCIRAAQRIGRLDPRHQLHLPTKDGDGFTLTVVHHRFPWHPEEFGPLLFCSDYDVVGLDNRFRTYGLGVPLICTRVEDGQPAPGRAFYPREVSFPVTAFFRFEGSVADLGARRAGRLELYNPLEIQTARVQGRRVPLETDLTTPLAYFLSKTDLEGLELTGFLRADKLRDRTGIYLFEPYQPGKIPVVMVHGLLSSPLTWSPLFNELRADPELRKHFQFWFYLYPTGNPYIASAADLRRALERLRQDVDPQRQDAALDQMVFVGHSMGGLVSKMLTQASGDDFWRLVTDEPFDTLKATERTRHELQRIFYFEPESSIKRVVFLGTPHHGSKLSPSPPAKLLAKFIRLPQRLMEAAQDVAEENPGLWPGLGNAKAPRLPTSLDLLSPGAPALELLAARPAPQGVHYHSIIGVAYGHGDGRTDGIVPYTSAHIDGVDSELIVPAIHTVVHHHPRAVLEVIRILREHLESLRQTGVQPAKGPPVELRPPTTTP
jgi:pimeloyl-ACP methyl ester carboxylesterase